MVSAIWSEVRPLTVARVPTGIKTGVSIEIPLTFKTPLRAIPSFLSRLKERLIRKIQAREELNRLAMKGP